MHLYFLSDGCDLGSTLQTDQTQKAKNKNLESKEPTAKGYKQKANRKNAGVTQEVHMYLLFASCGSKITLKSSPGASRIEAGSFKIKARRSKIELGELLGTTLEPLGKHLGQGVTRKVHVVNCGRVVQARSSHSKSTCYV